MHSASYVLFFFLLLFGPLAFGTVETWSGAVLNTITALSFLVLAAYLALNKKQVLRIPGALPLLLLPGYMLLQMIPLPPQLVELISPATFDLYRPLLELEPERHYIPLTVNRKNTLLMFFAFSSYGLVYMLTLYHCRKPELLKKTITIVVFLAIIIAVEAIIQKLTSPDMIYWFRPTPNSSPVGPWVYSNHFAGFMEMVFPLTIALFLFYRPQVFTHKTIREKFIYLLTMPGANRYLLLGSGAMLMAVSILLSVSRGGIITLSIAFFFFTFFSARTTADPRTRWAVILALLVVLMITWLGWQPIIDKFGNLWGERGLNTSGRLPVFYDSVALVKSFPLFGTGFGTFIDAYPSVRTVPGLSVFDHAHNDYIEFLATGGLIGFLLFGWFVAAVLFHSIRKLSKRRERYSILLTSGALTGILALLFHSLADFQLYNRANALYFFFLCGLAVSAATTRIQYRSRSTLLESASGKNILLPSMLAVMVLLGSPWHTLNIHRAETITAPIRSIFLNSNIEQSRLQQMHATVADACRLDPYEDEYYFLAGHLSSLLGNSPRAGQEYWRSCVNLPTSGRNLQRLALSRPGLDFAQKKHLLSLGPAREPLAAERYLTYSDWLLQNDLRHEAYSLLKTAMEKIPWRIKKIVNFIFARRFTVAELEMTMPPIPEAWYEVGTRMEQNGRLDEAGMFYRAAIDFVENSEINPSYFRSLYKLNLRQDKQQNALETLRLGISYLPDYSPFRVELGDYYLRQGIYYRAEQEYIRALQLDPNNRRILGKLKQAQQR
ncbi:MAG: O-antigen ligase family protein [Desulfobulbaceae bacterium]|nr:O-antigen ligase family protein [Desulfobulbaceae bacterium]